MSIQNLDPSTLAGPPAFALVVLLASLCAFVDDSTITRLRIRILRVFDFEIRREGPPKQAHEGEEPAGGAREEPAG